MSLSIGVQIDEVINFGRDTTFLLMKEAQLRGHQLFHYTVRDLSLNCDVPYASIKPVKIVDGGFSFQEKRFVPLDELNIILMRQNPPFDMRYITATYILEKCNKAVVLNDPKGVRNFPEKMSICSSLPTLITEDLELINEFCKEHVEVVMKPIYAFGGSGVSYIKEGGGNIKVLVNTLKEMYNCPVIVQKFCPDILNGDKRVMMLDGEILGVFSRIPQDGDFRSNLCLGNSYKESSLTTKEEGLCNDLGRELVENGIVFAGVDLIGENVIEVNVTSPTGLLELHSLYNSDVGKECWDCFESKLCKS